ncbi:carbohydrate ABC transporter substrate-binding protein [Rhizobium vallis]|uniref:Probable sugar-binding periplasmic protein n=1 Tax=Rhizobium vallis TaxID=634290 RepID=A0A432PCK1_9HYPH|nr:ABC transporter substrate-binding protein [Rhizobium vallis]RUM20434.1 carbohydrate ABC transporter substrate-binding protein [Rhizobium vallis]
MKKLAVAVSLATALLGSTAVYAADVEVVHWWTSGGEQAAAKVFAEEFNKTGDTWVDGAIALGETARATVMQRALGGDPPDVAQFNPGRQYEELIQAGLLLDLTPLAEKEGWDKFIRPKATADKCHIDGKWWCVPTNIHSQQWAWISNAAFEKAGITEIPTDIDGLVASLPALKKAGVIPIAVGGDGGGWQITLLANALFLNILGAEKREAVLKDLDTKVAAGPEVTKVFETIRALSEYSDEGAANRNWNDTTALVLNDRAGFQIMGDWAHGEFALAGKVAGKDYTCALGPSKKPYISLGGDIFVFFKQNDPEVERAQLSLASMMVSPEVQVKFNLAKGSLPIRSDVDMSAADACMQIGIPLLDDPSRVVPSDSTWRTEAFQQQENALYSDIWFNKDLSIADAQARFVDMIANAN